MSAISSRSAPVLMDDLPSVAISRLVAEKKIARDAIRTRIHLDGVTGEFGVARLDFPNGGWWLFVVCHCGKRVRSLWLRNDVICCRHCLKRVGLTYRCRGGDPSARIARLRSRLTSPSPARLHPRPKRVLDRRWRLEASLRRAEFVDRLRGLRRSAEWALDGDGSAMSFHSPVRRLGVPLSCRDLDLSVVAQVLVKHRANVHAAARELNVPSGDLRKLTWSLLGWLSSPWRRRSV